MSSCFFANAQTFFGASRENDMLFGQCSEYSPRQNSKWRLGDLGNFAPPALACMRLRGQDMPGPRLYTLFAKVGAACGEKGRESL